jgi:hypothetical protein
VVREEVASREEVTGAVTMLWVVRVARVATEVVRM